MLGLLFSTKKTNHHNHPHLCGVGGIFPSLYCGAGGQVISYLSWQSGFSVEWLEEEEMKVFIVVGLGYDMILWMGGFCLGM